MAFAVAAALVSAPPVAAQSRPQGQHHLYTFRGDAVGDVFGVSVAFAGDIDADGLDDVVVGAHQKWRTATSLNGAGYVRVFSGRQGRLLHEWRGRTQSGMFGCSVAAAGDVDRDGRPDVIVGEILPGTPGAATVFSGRTGAVLLALAGRSGERGFGTAVAGAGDVDRDGQADVLVGIPQWVTPGAGDQAVVFSGRDGRELYRVSGVQTGDGFGNAVAGVGDADRDGWPDFAVASARDGARIGYVVVHSGRDGHVLHTLYGQSPWDGFGTALRGAGDVDLDGHADVIVGAPPLSGGAGYVKVFSGRDGRVLRTLLGGVAGDWYGIAVDRAGDVDGDGYPDLLVGMTPESGVGERVVIHSGRDGRLLLTLQGTAPHDHFGWSLAGGGNVDGDGAPDLVVGAHQLVDSTGNAGRGYASVFASRSRSLASDTHALSLWTGGRQTLLLDAGAAHAGRLVPAARVGQRDAAGHAARGADATAQRG
jgi:hypothetical protein